MQLWKKDGICAAWRLVHEFIMYERRKSLVHLVDLFSFPKVVKCCSSSNQNHLATDIKAFRPKIIAFARV